MSKENYKAFAGMNFSAVRDENEPYTEYKKGSNKIKIC